MKFPFILRSDHDAIVDALRVSLDCREATIEALSEILMGKDEQIKALEAVLASKKCTEYTQKPSEKQEKSKFAVGGRGGWRTRAKLASGETFPPVSDSMTQLQEKIKREGGS